MGAKSFLSGCLMALGGLTMVLSGGCSLLFSPLLFAMPQLLAVFGGIPFATGFVLWGLGFLLRPKEEIHELSEEEISKNSHKYEKRRFGSNKKTKEDWTDYDPFEGRNK